MVAKQKVQVSHTNPCIILKLINCVVMKMRVRLLFCKLIIEVESSDSVIYPSNWGGVNIQVP